MSKLVIPSFFGLTKSQQLELLGDLYELLLHKKTREVGLDSFMNGCGSIGCAVGWAATNRSLADRLGVRLWRFDIDTGRPEGVHLGNLLLRQDLKRTESCYTYGTAVSYEEVFAEHSVGRFLFAPRQPEEHSRFGAHRTVALARLLYLGHLIDSSEVDSAWKTNHHEMDPSVRFRLTDVDFVKSQRALLVKNKFVLDFIQKIRSRNPVAA